MIILKPLTPSAVAVSQGTGGANLLTPDPKEVWVGGGAGAVNLDFNLGAVMPLDTFHLGFHTFPAAGRLVSITGGAAGYADAAFYDANFAGSINAPSAVASPLRRHALVKLAAPVNAQFVRFTVNTFSAAQAAIGIVSIGKSFQPTWNREKGGGRTIIDTGSIEQLPGGGYGIGAGTRKPGFRWVFGDLDDEELDQLFDLALDRGETRPVLVVEDPDLTPGLNERIHYGLFQRFEHYERADPGKHRWSLSVVQGV
jgi:hypothetical protein